MCFSKEGKSGLLSKGGFFPGTDHFFSKTDIVVVDVYGNFPSIDQSGVHYLVENNLTVRVEKCDIEALKVESTNVFSGCFSRIDPREPLLTPLRPYISDIIMYCQLYIIRYQPSELG